MSTVLVIPDIHAPFQHPKTIDFLQYVYNHFKCNRVVCLGDEMDFHAISRWPKDPDGFAAGLEFSFGLSFLKELYLAFPICETVYSNHTARPYRNAYDYGLPKAFLKDYKTLLEAPDGWSWQEFVEIDNVLYIHGEGFSGQSAHVKAAVSYRQSVVIGHVHSFGGVQYMQTKKDRIFGMNAGCLINQEAYAFKYARAIPNKPTIGCGVVINGIHAFFIPLHEG